MHASDTRALRFETRALQSDTKTLRQTWQITLDKVNLLADQLAKLEEENGEIKGMMAEILKEVKERQS